MKRSIIFGLILCFALPLFLTSCKSEFEKVRASGDTQLLYKKAYEYYETEEYLKAQTLFELLIGAYRGKKELEDIYYKYADTYYKLDRFILASYYYKNFTTTFPNSLLREEADYMVAYSNYRLSPVYRLDQTYSQEAIEAFQTFTNTYPESPRVIEANQLIDEMRRKMEVKAFAAAKLYYEVKQYQAALASYEGIIKDFPETTNGEEVRYMMVKASYEMAINSVYDKREKRFQDAIKNSENFIAKYNDSTYFNEVKVLYNNSQKKLKDFTNGRYKEQSSGS